MSRQLGAAGKALIQSFEKCVLIAYQDQGGIWTIGWGHTGPEVCAGLTWTQDQADAAFVADVSKVVAAVDFETPQTITQNQFDALVSFGFNVGVESEAHSTLLRFVGANLMVAASNEFARWVHVNGVTSTGLVRRRSAERELFLRSDA